MLRIGWKDVARVFLFCIENFEKLKNNIYNFGLEDVNLTKIELAEKIKEQIKSKKTKILDSADFHHQLHHRYFDCNYGNMDVPLDIWFGTHHDGSEKATKEMRLRIKGVASN